MNHETYVCPVSTKEPDCEMSISPVSVNAPGFDLSAGPLLSSVLNSELSVCPVPVYESNFELSICLVFQRVFDFPVCQKLSVKNADFGAMSRIRSMNFCLFTTRGHLLTTLTLAPH